MFGAPREQSAKLSDILETGHIPARFYLSPRACQGILRRAEKRGKELPPLLKQALETVARTAPENPEDQTDEELETEDSSQLLEETELPDP